MESGRHLRRKELARADAFVFDLDGTLVDTVETRIVAWLRTFEEFGIKAHREQVAKLIGSDGKRVAQVVAQAAGEAIDSERAEEIDKRAGDIYSELNTDPKGLPGAIELLRALDDHGLLWAVATSSRREQVDASINALALARRPLIIDGSQVKRAKPAPDLLLMAARELGVEPSRGWYVGDAIWDMQAARAAGMPAIGVVGGSATAEELAEAGASFTVKDLTELIPLLSSADNRRTCD
ncbi:MAG TPA: HAD family phosphatase [Candidatus Dormibacteraeota bacterium]|nr:HAD family phosphatase [Candidatus Dormibacteraeota bacterium]